MQQLELLKTITFGEQIAENEIGNLAKYFVETDDWHRIESGKIDIIRGDKGAGKSAIYSLLNSRRDQFFDNNIFLISAENPQGETVFRDLAVDPPATERQFIVLWKLYIVSLIAQQLREFDINTRSATRLCHVLEDAELIERELSLPRLLRDAQNLAKRLIGGTLETGVTLDTTSGAPDGIVAKISLGEPSRDLRTAGVLSINSLFQLADAALAECGFKTWILLDRLDSAFNDNHTLEVNALRALLRVYRDLAEFKNISLKIFLREDIWGRVVEGGFREASHITSYVILNWNLQSLWNLTLRRLLSNEALVNSRGFNVTEILGSVLAQDEVFYSLFPDQVEQGKQKPRTFNWMITRCADATKKTAPRELIHLLNCVRNEQIKRIERGQSASEDGKLFERSVFKTALPIVSATRLHSYLYAEYSQYKPWVELLRQQKAEQTIGTLMRLWNLSEDETRQKAAELKEIGFFEQHEKHDETTYWVPFLYRDALDLVQGRERDEDDGDVQQS